MGEAPGHLLQRPDKVEAPDIEGLGDGDHLQSLSREVGLPCVVLATLTGPNDLRGVYHGGGLVETLSKGVSYQRLRCCLVAASPEVNLPKEIRALRVGDAPHEDT